MAKGTKLSEFEKGKITALKRVGKSQREISEVLGCSKTYGTVHCIFSFYGEVFTEQDSISQLARRFGKHLMFVSIVPQLICYCRNCGA